MSITSPSNDSGACPAGDTLRAEELQALFELASVGMAQVDITTCRVVRANRALCEMTGYAAAELAQRPLVDILHADDRDAELARLHLVAAGDTDRWRCEHRYLHRDGVVRWALESGAVLRGDGDRPARGLVVIQDITERKQAEEALRASEERFRTAQELSLDAFVILRAVRDAEGRVIDLEYDHANPAAVRALHMRSEELRGRRLLELFPGAREEIFHRYVHVLESGEPLSIDISYDKDGYNGCWRTVAVRLDDGVALYCTDISERKRAEEALRRSEDRFNAFMDNSPVRAFMKDAQGRYVYVNHYAERELGLSRATWFGKTDRDIFAPETAKSYRDNDLTVMRTGQTQRFVEPVLIAGEMRYALAFKFLLTGPDGEPLIGGISIDVTDQTRYQHSLEDSEARFRAFFELAAAGAAQADPATYRLLAVNERLCQITGYTRDELLSMSIGDLTHPDDRERDAVMLGRMMRGEIPEYVVEKRYVRKDGEVVWAHVAAAPVRDRDGQPKHTVAIIHDITARRRAEEALVEADRRKDEFLAMLAHELRNPLSAIQSALSLLDLPELGAGQRARAEEVMKRQVKQLGRLIDDLLDVSRITRGKIQLRIDRVDLGEVMRQAVDTVMPLVDSLQHQLTVSSAGARLWLDGDIARLEQVVVNLLTNAAKYTPPGGRIWLSVQREGDEAIIRVRDTGIGIAGDMLPRVFDLFAQAQRSLDRSQGGLGIGLTLVKKLVEMHGGSVSASSEGEGRGSEFTVRLPLARTVHTVRTGAGDASAGRGATQRILVVDDNRDSAMTLAMLLEVAGHQTALAYDGEEALAAARTFRPDVVLLDIGLPAMDGYAVARELRKTPGLEDVVLIAVSGYGQAEDRRRSREAGFDEHMLKPVDAHALLTRIAALIARHG